MNIIRNLVSLSKYGIKCPYEMDAEFIVVHNTYNDAPARNEIAYMIGNNQTVSFHYAIDDKEIVQGIEENRNAFHAGDGATGDGNRKGIAIEICYSESGGERFIAAEKLAAKFIAFKLNEKGWGIDKVKKHQDFNGKYCPHRTLDMGWNRFLDMIEAELKNDIKYFSDVPQDAWYADSVNYCKEHGLMQGVGDGKFNPNEPVTRAQLAAVAARLHKALS
jgi:N-acetylmuramoyl-L-alanine amidase CwlA